MQQPSSLEESSSQNGMSVTSQHYEHAVFDILSTWLVRDLIAMVCRYAITPVLLVLGGYHAPEGAVGDVWMNDSWTSVPLARVTGHSRRNGYGQDIGAVTTYVDWTWFVVNSGCGGGSAIRARGDDVARQVYTWDPADPTALHIECTGLGVYHPRPASWTRVAASPDGTLYCICKQSEVVARHEAAAWPSTTHNVTAYYDPDEQDTSATKCYVTTFDLMTARPGSDTDRVWRTVVHCPLSLPQLQSVVFVLEDKCYSLYALFGQQCHVYRPSTRAWQELGQSRVVRSFVQPALDAKRGHIYAVGGSGASVEMDELRSCERLSVHSGQWTNMPCMHHARWGAVLVVLNDELIAVGGQDVISRSTTSTAERMSLDLDREGSGGGGGSVPHRPHWVLMPSMNASREDALALVRYEYCIVVDCK